VGLWLCAYNRNEALDHQLKAGHYPSKTFGSPAETIINDTKSESKERNKRTETKQSQ
jgi:hypothetical protein